LTADEIFGRSEASESRSFLTDALGSTLALSDLSGKIQTQYLYAPFGTTTSTGSPSANSFQYAGRENDGTGLYYYRARYYSPAYSRFISQDPLGLVRSGSDYVYAFNDPINRRDPAGLYPLPPIGPFVSPLATSVVSPLATSVVSPFAATDVSPFAATDVSPFAATDVSPFAATDVSPFAATDVSPFATEVAVPEVIGGTTSGWGANIGLGVDYSQFSAQVEAARAAQVASEVGTAAVASDAFIFLDFILVGAFIGWSAGVFASTSCLF
jgi:RHS repeat-associated protein